MVTLSTYHSAIPSLDIFHLEASKPADTLPHEMPGFTAPEYDSEDDSENELCSFDALVSTRYKKVVNHIQPVWTDLARRILYCPKDSS